MNPNNILTTILGYGFIGISVYDLLQMHHLGGFDIALLTFTGLAMIVFKQEGLKKITTAILTKNSKR